MLRTPEKCLDTWARAAAFSERRCTVGLGATSWAVRKSLVKLNGTNIGFIRPFLFSGHHSSPRKSVKTGCSANHCSIARERSFPPHPVTSFLLSWPDKFEFHSLQQGPLTETLRISKTFSNVAVSEVSRQVLELIDRTRTSCPQAFCLDPMACSLRFGFTRYGDTSQTASSRVHFSVASWCSPIVQWQVFLRTASRWSVEYTADTALPTKATTAKLHAT